MSSEKASRSPMHGYPDAMQLSALAAAASSAASSTAYAVDGVVKEAVLFFAAMPPSTGPVRRPGINGFGQVEISEEVFRLFEIRVHADACSAAEACAEAHQHATRDRESIGKAALAASCVGTLAERTATTAREVAQLCMGILEEAVQANASPFARETAKRCAEQALRSVEAAGVAEQHSRSLCELLAPVMLGNEYHQHFSGGTANQVAATVTLKIPQTPWLGSSQELNTSMTSVRRWWDVCSSERNGASVPKAKLQEDAVSGNNLPNGWEETISSVDALEKHLARRVADCAALVVPTADLAADRENECALKAILEWRLGVAMANGCVEEKILSDGHSACFACWRAPAEEALPTELHEAARGCGQESFSGLVAALQGATRQPFLEKAPDTSNESEVPCGPFPGPFQHALSEATDFNVDTNDLDARFDCLDWIAHDAASQGQASGKIGQPPVPLTSSSALAAIASWQVAGLDPSVAESAVEGPLDPTDDAWSIDQMTLRQLHLMSMHSRSKQRRGAAVKHKGGEDGAGPPTASVQSEASPALEPVDDEGDVREFLREVFGDCESPTEEATDDTNAAAVLSTSVSQANATPPASGAVGAARGAARKKKGKVRSAAAPPTPAARGGTGPCTGAATSTMLSSGLLLSGRPGGKPGADPHRLDRELAHIGPPEDANTSVRGQRDDRQEDDETLDGTMNMEADAEVLHSMAAWGVNDMQAGLQQQIMPLSLGTGYPGQYFPSVLQGMPQSYAENAENFRWQHSVEGVDHLASCGQDPYNLPPGLGCNAWASLVGLSMQVTPGLSGPLDPRSRVFDASSMWSQPFPQQPR